MAQKTPYLEYRVILTDSGRWLHAVSSPFLFTYIENDWNSKVKESVIMAFEDALSMPSRIEEAVKTITGQDVVKGLYLLDQALMTKAMDSIDGMSETFANQHEEKGDGTAESINDQFFGAVLAGLRGDLEPIREYLREEMGAVQEQTRESTVTKCFGIVIGLIYLKPSSDVPVTAFKYCHSSEETSEWFVRENCRSTTRHSYDYKYTVVDYNYVKP